MMELGTFPKGTKVLKKYTLMGVYFLIQDEEVIYVGQAKNIYSRIHTHLIEGKKIFNKVKYIECDESDLSITEYFSIQRFRPKHNIHHNDAASIISRNKQSYSVENSDLSVKEYIRRSNL